MGNQTENNYPIELTPVDILPYKTGNTGTNYITTLDSGQSGPHAMITAVVHGNELCGAIALDFLFKNKIFPIFGKLTLAFANHQAYHTFDPKSPMSSRFIDEDLNRVWNPDVLNGPRITAETLRARELRPFIDEADFLLDIHSMQHKTPALMICGHLQKGQKFAKTVKSTKFIVSDRGHQAGTRMRDYDAFNDPESTKKSLLVECGQHWEYHSAKVAIDTALRFLKCLQIIDKEFCKDNHIGEFEAQTLIEVSDAVTIKHATFTFADEYFGFEVIKDQGTIIGWDGNKEVLTPYDNCVLIMPSKRLNKGQTAVRLGRIVD